MIKYFSGHHPPEQGSNDTAWKLKNESSLAAMSFDYLQYDMMARQNGGNKTFLKTRMLQILDYRLRSKLKMQKAVIYTAEHTRRSTSSGQRHASNLFSSFGPVQTVENQSKQDDDEEDFGKIAHVDKLKKSMFSKYFAKDDFMVALEPYIYTQEELNPKEDQAKANEKNGEDDEKSERVHKKEMLLTNLKQETLSQAIAGCFNYIFTCRCARKKKDAEHRSIGVGNTDHGILESLPMVAEGIKQSADEEEKLLQMGLYQPDEPEKKMSDLLLERFTCKEVDWQITTMNQTRSRVKPDDYLLISGNFLKAEANGYDLYMEMESEWDGETILEMKIFNKTVLLLPDFLTEVLFFLKKPFSEREYHRSKDPKEKFNNYAPMLVKLDIRGMTIVWPSNLESLEQTVLQFETNLKMLFEFQGDSGEGPGLYAMKIELDIAKGSEKSFSMAGANIGSIQETRYENKSYGDLYQAGISNRDTLSVDKMPGGASKLRKQGSPKKKTLLGGIAGGYMIEKVCVTYEQKYIIKNSMKVFPDEKADYITKVSMSKRGDSAANECNLYVPVTLLNKLETLFSTISSPSAEHKNQKYDSKSSKISKHEEDLESQYNEIYELSLPKLNLMIVREYKGEELIRFEFRELNLYFRKERKNRPVEALAVSDNFKKAKVCHR